MILGGAATPRQTTAGNDARGGDSQANAVVLGVAATALQTSAGASSRSSLALRSLPLVPPPGSRSPPREPGDVHVSRIVWLSLFGVSGVTHHCSKAVTQLRASECYQMMVRLKWQSVRQSLTTPYTARPYHGYVSVLTWYRTICGGRCVRF